MSWLKQSTAVTVKMGPFVDATDGNTDETGLTIQKADVRLTKNGGDMAAANADQGASDAGAPHDEIGHYDIALNATDTATLGRLRVAIHKTGALHVWRDFMVVPANVYDSLVAGSDTLQADAVEVSGDATAADTLELFAEALDQATGQLDSGSIATNAFTSSKFATGFLNSGGLDATAASEIATAVWASATRILTAGTNIVLAKGTGVTGFNDLDAAGVRGAVGLASANLDTQLAAIAGFIDTEVGTIITALGVIDGNVDLILADTDELQTNQGNWLTATGFSTHSAGDAADAVWDEVLSGHLTAGSTGNALNAAGSAGDPWSTTLPGAYGAGSAGYILGTNLNAAVGSRSSHSAADVRAEVDANSTQLAAILLDTGTTIPAQISGLNNLSTGDIDARLAAYDAPTKAEMDAAFTQIKGATWSASTDTLEAIRDRGDAAWTTATGFSTLDAGGVRSAVGLASANLDTQLSAVAAAIAALNNPTVAAIADAVCDELLSGHATAGSLGKAISDILDDTGTSGVALSSATLDAIATSLLDLADGVETNQTVREHFRLVTAALLGLCSGMGTASGVFRDFNNTKDRITVTTDASGNRTAITRDAS